MITKMYLLRAVAAGAGLGLAGAYVLNDPTRNSHWGYVIAALVFAVVTLIPKPKPKPKHRADKDT